MRSKRNAKNSKGTRASRSSSSHRTTTSTIGLAPGLGRRASPCTPHHDTGWGDLPYLGQLVLELGQDLLAWVGLPGRRRFDAHAARVQHCEAHPRLAAAARRLIDTHREQGEGPSC